IFGLANAFLDDPESGLDAATVERIRNLPQHHLSLDDDTDLKSAVKLYLKLSHAGKDYEAARQSLMESKDVEDFLTLYQAKRAVEQLSGVSGIMHDMCFNLCVGFTGQFVHLGSCPICRSLRYDQVVLAQSKGRKKVARKQFATIPFSPQLQAMFRNPCRFVALLVVFHTRCACTLCIMIRPTLNCTHSLCRSISLDLCYNQKNSVNIV
ncbi:uncharacterized protein F5891DRAFT_967157, partial [Suillus fuscotomentosus]